MKALRIIYGDKTSSFDELLEKSNSVSIHHINLWAPATEVYKVSNMSPIARNDIFASIFTPFNLQNPVSFKMWKAYVVYNGTETLSHLGSRI